MENEAEAIRALDLYGDMVRRICFIHLKNDADTEDIFQEVFLKYILRHRPFTSDAHEKAWLIRVAINACKDLHKSFLRRNVVFLDDLYYEPVYLPEGGRDVLNAVLQLPYKYRNVIYLFYYEGYSAVEIAKILNKNANTIYTWLDRGKKELKEKLGGAPNG